MNRTPESTGSPSGWALEVEELRHSYGEHTVLEGISFRIPRGQIVGYLGPNGAGKTTTVRVLIGALVPTSGLVRVGGVEVVRSPLEVKKRLGYVPEAGGLYQTLSPFEFLQFVGGVHGLSDDALAARIPSMLDVLGLAEQIHEPMQGFSKGMKQKVVLASALIHDPEVVILDEPLSGLDANAALLFKEIIVQMAQAGKTVFYCSHILDVVERVCDRVIILNRGHIVADGSPAELRASERGSSLEEVFRSLTAEVDFADMASRLLGSLEA